MLHPVVCGDRFIGFLASQSFVTVKRLLVVCFRSCLLIRYRFYIRFSSVFDPVLVFHSFVLVFHPSVFLFHFLVLVFQSFPLVFQSVVLVFHSLILVFQSPILVSSCLNLSSSCFCPSRQCLHGHVPRTASCLLARRLQDERGLSGQAPRHAALCSDGAWRCPDRLTSFPNVARHCRLRGVT